MKEPDLRGTCSGMVPGGGLSDEERRRADAQYIPERLRREIEKRAALSDDSTGDEAR